MPISPTYPGVYIQELPSGVHTITGASTSNTAFVDFFARGPVGKAQLLSSFTDFENYFGGLDKRSEASYQIMQYYLNGGQTSYVVRVVPASSVTADVDLREQNIVMPNAATLGGGMQQQFTATIDGGVTWTVTSTASTDKAVIGSIDPASGIYTAPAVVASEITVSVWAQSSACCKNKPFATVTLIPVEVTVTGADSAAGPGQQIQFRAAVAGASDQRVKWYLASPSNPNVPVSDPKYGTIDGNGLYSAPGAVTSQLPAVVVAISVIPPPPAAPAASSSSTSSGSSSSTSSSAPPLPSTAGSAPLTIKAIHVTAATGTIGTNQSVLLTAWTAASVSPSSISWQTAAGSCPSASGSSSSSSSSSSSDSSTSSGSSSSSGPAAPTGQTFCFSPTAAGKFAITATANGASDCATVTVSQQYTVTISVNVPADADGNYDVEVGNSLEFSATTLGDPSNAVTWTASAGTIDDQGVYTAPASLPSPVSDLQVIVTAVSANDQNTPPQQATFTISVNPPKSRFRVKAMSPGVWGNLLRATAIMPRLFNPASPTFTLSIQETDGNGNVLKGETFSSLSADPNSANYCVSVVNEESTLVDLVDFGTDFAMPFLVPWNSGNLTSGSAYQNLTGGEDGAWDATTGEFANALMAAVTDDSSPLSYLAPDIFNILCLPATANLDPNAAGQVMTAAQTYCAAKRAFYIVDIPNSQAISSPQAMSNWFENNLPYLGHDCAAVYYPRVQLPDPLNDYRMRECGYSGSMAGLYASTDFARGTWKAPAGTQIPLAGATPVYVMKDTDNGVLNPLGINAIRSFPVYGILSWGARTLRGADELADQWKYIPVRRMAYYIENSLYAGLTWAVFEPNDTPLWSSIVLNVNAFMNSLFRQGAFQGSSPKDAYFVKCDASTTSQYDIDRGVVNVIVGFAPLKPAEFVIVQIQQIAASAA